MADYSIRTVTRYLVGGVELDTLSDARQYAVLREAVDLLLAALVPSPDRRAIGQHREWQLGRAFVQHPRSSVEFVRDRLKELTIEHAGATEPIVWTSQALAWTSGRPRLRPLYEAWQRLERIADDGREFSDVGYKNHAVRYPGRTPLTDLTAAALAA